MLHEYIINKKAVTGFRILIGGIFLVFGILTLEVYVGIVFLLVSIVAFTYSSGIEVDDEQNRIRSFTRFLWTKSGNWMDLDSFDGIKVRRSRKGIRRYGGRTHLSTSSFSNYYNVYLFSQTLKKGILLFTSKDKEESLQYAQWWSEEFDIPHLP